MKNNIQTNGSENSHKTLLDFVRLENLEWLVLTVNGFCMGYLTIFMLVDEKMLATAGAIITGLFSLYHWKKYE